MSLSLIPKRGLGRALAPSSPKKFIRNLAWLALALVAIMAFTVPGGLMPGVAKSSVKAGDVLIEFESGDRYFWLPAQTKEPLTAKDVVEQIPGSQSLTKRSSFGSVERQFYDEEKGGEDFTVTVDNLYEVAIVDRAATVSAEATPGTFGKDFTQEIRDGSNAFLKRLGSYFTSLPGIIWDDLKQVKEETASLFNGESDGERAGAGQAAAQTLKTKWPVLVGVVALVFVLPFLGVDNLYIGLIAGGVLSTGGTPVFYVLAAGAAAAGFVLDNNRLPASSGAGVLTAMFIDDVSEFASENRRIVGAVIIFLASFAASFTLAWLGHVSLSAIITIVGGLCVTVMLASLTKRAGKYGPADSYTLVNLKPTPGLVLFVLVAANAAWLFHLGYQSFAWGLTILASLAFMFWLRAISLRAEAEAQKKTYRPALRRSKAIEATLDNYRSANATVKVVGLISALTVWLALAAITSGDYIVATAYGLIGAAGLVLFTFFIWPAKVDDEEEDDEEPVTQEGALNG